MCTKGKHKHVKTPSVSVLITAYNREKYIAEAIESVLAQTFTDFELIIVDDCSKDRTVEIARRYTCDSRVRLHVNEKNVGDYPNRNRAAALAQGSYLKYLDSDDVLYPHGLGAMVNIMRKFPSAALGVQHPVWTDQPGPLLLTPEQAYRDHFVHGGLFNVGPTGTIILASAFRSLGGFSGKRFVGDTELWLKLAARYLIVKFMMGLVWWRCHDGQEINAESASFPYGTVGYMMNQEALNAQDCPLSKEERQRAMCRRKYRHARSILRLALINCRPRRAVQIMRQTSFSVSDLRFAFSSSKGFQGC